MRPTDGKVRVLHLDPRPDVEPEGEHRDERRAGFPDVLVARAGFLGRRASAAERGGEVDQVVPDDAPALVLDEGVERVDAPRVVVIQPGREHAQAAKLPPVLVIVDVVRVVRPRAVVAERAERRAGQRLARHDAVRAVGVAGGLREDRIQVGGDERARAAVGALDRRVRRQSAGRRDGASRCSSPERDSRARGRTGSAMTSAPVAISGFDGGSNFTKYMSPRASAIVSPGVMPSFLPETIVHTPGSGPVPATGPVSTSSAVMTRVPMRFVNQLESGTSSSVLTLDARTSRCSPASRNEFWMKSYDSFTFHGLTWEASWVSGSASSGSSR